MGVKKYSLNLSMFCFLAEFINDMLHIVYLKTSNKNWALQTLENWTINDSLLKGF